MTSGSENSSKAAGTSSSRTSRSRRRSVSSSGKAGTSWKRSGSLMTEERTPDRSASTRGRLPRAEVGVQQAVEQVLAGLPAHGRGAGAVGARAEAPLHRLADGDVLALDALGHGDAGLVPGARRGRVVGEVVVEDHLGAVDP